jgi:Na+-transporting NADH:ubiquinone oxidoreductase subunit F
MCKCQVLKGGGNILPTETGQLTRREQKNHVRLACQVKVRNDMKIRIPDEVFHIKKFDCVVKSNHNVATFIKELVLQLPEGHSLDFQAGGYIQIDIPPYKVIYKDFDVEKRFHPDWDKFNLWDLKAENDEPIFRAYSMANHPGEKGIVMLNVRIATPPPNNMSLPPGKASSYIFNLKPGDKVTISGPYGEFFIKDTKREMIYIGGGAGMAPLRSHLFHLFHTSQTRDRKVTYWYGARSKREMFYTEDFENIENNFPNFKYNVALSAALPEDNWKGYTGFIHQVLYEQYLKNHPEPEECEYYLCGPPMMIDAVQNMLDRLGVPKEMIAFDSFG